MFLGSYHSTQELLSQKRTGIMANISSAVKVDAAQIGVSVADVRIRRADLPAEVLQAINERMKTEREEKQKEFRAMGKQEAQMIRAKAEKEQAIILAEADKSLKSFVVKVIANLSKFGMMLQMLTLNFMLSIAH